MTEDPNETWRVFFRRKVEKQIGKMPRKGQVLFANLVEDLIRKGPIRTEWCNFRKLSDREMEIEVYYAGSREKAPY